MNYLSVNSSLLRAINLAHPELEKDVQVDDVVFGAPELYLMGQCNTRIKITAKDASVHFKNNGFFYYNRNRLDWFLRGIRVPGKPADYTDTRQVVAALVEHYGLPLTPNEYLLATTSGPQVLLTPTITNLGFFIDFPATLDFIGAVPFVGIDVKFKTSKWNYVTTATYERRSWVAPTPGQPPLYGSGLSQRVFTIQGKAVELRAIETGPDAVDGVESWRWVSVQFHGNVLPEHLAQIIDFNGVKGVFAKQGYNTAQNVTFVTYRMASSVQFDAGVELSVSF